MATYAIGDLQGCYSALMRLLDTIRFDSAQDQLWFAGDLVSRGTESLATLRLVKTLCERQNALTVLGNHDISLIASYYGVRKAHKSLSELTQAEDYGSLIAWLRRQPLLHYSPSQNALLVHAGVSPCWDLPTTIRAAVELEAELQQANPSEWLAQIYGDTPNHWNPTEQSLLERQRYALNVLTRIRYCDETGALDFTEKNAPAQVNAQWIPWFLHPHRPILGATVIFGHWSTLGYYRGVNVVGLDTGCVWNGKLTAFCLETQQCYQVDCI